MDLDSSTNQHSLLDRLNISLSTSSFMQLGNESNKNSNQYGKLNKEQNDPQSVVLKYWLFFDQMSLMRRLFGCFSGVVRAANPFTSLKTRHTMASISRDIKPLNNLTKILQFCSHKLYY